MSADTEQEESGKEPGGWELYRGIRRVESAIHEIATTSVSAAVFAVKEQALNSRIDAVVLEQSNQKAAQLASDNALATYAKEQEAQKGRNRALIYGIIAAALAPSLVNLLATSVLT